MLRRRNNTPPSVCDKAEEWSRSQSNPGRDIRRDSAYPADNGRQKYGSKSLSDTVLWWAPAPNQGHVLVWETAGRDRRGASRSAAGRCRESRNEADKHSAHSPDCCGQREKHHIELCEVVFVQRNEKIDRFRIHSVFLLSDCFFFHIR